MQPKMVHACNEARLMHIIMQSLANSYSQVAEGNYNSDVGDVEEGEGYGFIEVHL